MATRDWSGCVFLDNVVTIKITFDDVTLIADSVVFQNLDPVFSAAAVVTDLNLPGPQQIKTYILPPNTPLTTVALTRTYVMTHTTTVHNGTTYEQYALPVGVTIYFRFPA
jgi:hypothetical protein